MSKTTEEKIDEIHTAVVEMRADFSANKVICASLHKTIDSRMDGLHRKLVGNGQPGIEQNLATLTSRFDKMETRLIAWAGVAVFLGQIVGPRLLRIMGWN